MKRPKDRAPGSWFMIDDIVMQTECGHSFATCHSDRCFLGGKMYKLDGEVVDGSRLKVGDKFRVVGPEQTVVKIEHEMVHTDRYEYHLIGYETEKTFVRTSKAKPEGWSPQPDDVWVNPATGDLYHAIAGRFYSSVTGSNFTYDNILSKYPDLKLHFRKGGK